MSETTEMLEVIARRLERIEAIVTNNMPGALVSGTEAARMLGVSTSTFRRRYLDAGRIRYSAGKKFARADIETLVAADGGRRRR